MRRSNLYLSLTALTVALCALPAAAQEPQETGRYQLYQGAIESGELGAYPVLLDTQYGRTWILVQDKNSGFVWRQIPVLKLKPLGDDLLAQPNPASGEPKTK